MSHAFRATMMVAAAASALSGMAGERLYAQGVRPQCRAQPRTRCRKTGRSCPRVGNSEQPSRSRSTTAMARASGVFDRCGATECTNSTLAPMEKFDSSGKFQKAIGADKVRGSARFST